MPMPPICDMKTMAPRTLGLSATVSVDLFVAYEPTAQRLYNKSRRVRITGYRMVLEV